ncbi:MAG: ferrochelatase, partial [Planctomycetota bacterium]
MNLGTPDAPEVRSVRRYLSEFLADPEVITLPRRIRWLTKPLAMLIALLRAKASAHAYRTIWTEQGSPLKVITEDQVKALQRNLPGGWKVFYAMRYGNPSVAATLQAIVEDGIRDLLVIPMYPQFSGPTTRTALGELYRHLQKLGPQLQLTVRHEWYDDVGYVDAQAQLLHDFAVEHQLDPSNCVLLFSAHSMPESYIRRGDPYQDQILRTVELVTARLGWPADRMQVAYQSKLGPVPWLSPSTQESVQDLAAAGVQNVLVCPLSFTADCLETIEEIGIRYRQEFEASGGHLHLCPALNTYEPFVKVLSRLVLRGPRSAAECRSLSAPIFQWEKEKQAEDDSAKSLVMIGTSLPARLGNGVPRKLHHVTQEQFLRIKRPQEEVAELLSGLRSSQDFAECWLWNTCSRFEFYGWLSDRDRTELEARLAEAVDVIRPESNGVPMNTLHGRDAWHHLLRTAAGLNSRLPGDGELFSQMDAAHRIAAHSETAGPRTRDLRATVETCLDDLRQRTEWGRFQSEYCPVALKRLALDLAIDWTQAKCVVVGASITAQSVIRTLRKHFDVPDRNLTAVYRTQSRGTRIKQLRKELGNGTRLRVDAYTDARLLQAAADVDVVIFALDVRAPVVDRESLQDARDFAARPLTIIDFNSFGSTAGVDGLDGVRVVDAAAVDGAVAEFAGTLMACPAFSVAKEQAECEIYRHLDRVAGEPQASPNAAGHPTSSDGRGCPCPLERR